MKMINATDVDPVLAIALGRFTQASAQLERSIQSAIIRLLPLSDDMGLTLLCENSIRTNLDILSRVIELPSVPIPEDWKKRLQERIPKVKRSSEDRNRLVHNVIMEAEQGYIAAVEKKGTRVALPIDAATIAGWADEANEHSCWFMTVPHGVYDFSQWENRWPEYEVKNWPARPA